MSIRNISSIPQYIFFLCAALCLSLLPGCQQNKYTITKKRTTPMVAIDKGTKAPAAVNKHPGSMTIDELRESVIYSLSVDHKELAIEYVERLIKKSNDQEELKNLRLQLADLFFEMGRMKDAARLYSMYLNLYPGSQDRAYVHYQAILCRFYMSYTADRDQVHTEDALKLTQEYADKLKADKETLYARFENEVKNVQEQCIAKLFESEKNIYDFYYRRQNYTAAKIRLAHMKERFVPLMRSCEYDLLNLECDLAKQLKDDELLIAKTTEINSKYPQQPQRIVLAQNNEIKRKHPVDLF